MPDVIMWYRGGGGCELYIHSAPSWQQCLLTPQSSQLWFHPQLSCIYKVVHVEKGLRIE